MSLGVLNNLSAIYAENNLNKTNSSLNTVLQQLSSGSRINSGADDAAGLSLINGLQANSMALSQSQTNATEGVGLLTVADGALSQVTNLLNRAVTLATEASNGTLNASQDAAANQEYQSILAEITNIGATTTYNQQAVFGKTTDIYTGDSSVLGSSITSLNIGNLSSSSIGDTGGVLSYSNGQNNVFLNLSSANKNAQVTDSLNASGTSTINVNYLVKGANGSSTPASTSISVGTGTSYANTASGLISAINNSGLGLSASFATQAQAGVAGGGTQTGIEITGGLLSVGVDPNAASTSGTLNPSEITNDQLTLGQTITVKVGSATAASVTIDDTNNTLDDLALAINNANGGVTATVVTGSGGAKSLQLADSSSTGGALTVTTTPGSIVRNVLTAGTVVQASDNPVNVNFNAGATGQAGTKGTATLGISGTNDGTLALQGSITLSNGSNTKTFVMGGIAGESGDTVTLGSGASTLNDLASAIQTHLGATAAVGASGIAMSSVASGTAITMGTSNLEAVASVGVTSNVAGLAATAGSVGVTTLSMSNGAKGFAAGDPLTGNIVLQNGSGQAYTFTMGSGAAYDGGTHTYTTATTDVNGLVGAINTSTATTGMSAQLSGGKIVLTTSNVGSTIALNSSTLADTKVLTFPVGAQAATSDVYSSVDITAAVGDGGGSLTQLGDLLTGSIDITNDGVTKTFVMGSNAADTGNTINISAANSNLSGLMNAINTTGSALGITASLDKTGTASGLTLTANNYGTTIAVAGAGLKDAATMTFTSPASGGLGSQYQSGVLSLADNGVLQSPTGGLASGTLSGQIQISSDVGGSGVISKTFVIGADTAGSTLGDLVTAINGFAGLNLTASIDASTGGLFIQSKATTDTSLSVDASGLTNTLDLTAGTVTAGSIAAPATALVSNGGVSAGTDLLKQGTSIILTNSAMGVATTFTMGGTTAGNVIGVGTAGDASTQTLQALAQAIIDAGLNLSASVSSAGLQITATDQGSITVGGGSDLAEKAGIATFSTTGGAGPTSATNAAVSLNTSAHMAAADALTGQVTLKNGNGTAITFVMGGTAGVSGNTVTLGSGTSTLQDLANAITSNASLGITASVNGSTGALQLQSNALNTSIAVSANTLADPTAEVLSASAAGNPAQFSTGTFSLAGNGNNFDATHQLTGSIDITANNVTKTFVMGGVAGTNGNTITLGAGYSTVSDLESAITNSGLGVSVALGNGGANLTITSTTANNNAVAVANNTLQDTMGHAASTASLGTFASATDQVSGTVSFKVDGQTQSFQIADGQTVQDLVNQINTGANGNQVDPYGVHAELTPTGNGGFQELTLTSNTFGTAGNISNVATVVNDEGASSTLSYTAANAYNVGISNVNIYDSSSGQSAPTSAFANLTANSGGASGVGTLSYSHGAGQSLSATSLATQAEARDALTQINAAITAVSAQDGYIGAMINTLNAVSSVLATQSQNVIAAQNAVQATDYASAASNMSKYQILSQTGIAALSQANSMQREVTKLLQ